MAQTSHLQLIKGSYLWITNDSQCRNQGLLAWGQGKQGLANWSSRIVEDKDFSRGEQLWQFQIRWQQAWLCRILCMYFMTLTSISFVTLAGFISWPSTALDVARNIWYQCAKREPHEVFVSWATSLQATLSTYTVWPCLDQYIMIACGAIILSLNFKTVRLSGNQLWRVSCLSIINLSDLDLWPFWPKMARPVTAVMESLCKLSMTFHFLSYKGACNRRTDERTYGWMGAMHNAVF